jgi:hypothetical protein
VPSSVSIIDCEGVSFGASPHPSVTSCAKMRPPARLAPEIVHIKFVIVQTIFPIAQMIFSIAQTVREEFHMSWHVLQHERSIPRVIFRPARMF